MADFLDWGTVEYTDVKVGRYPVDEGGRRLFLIRNGEAEFPGDDYRVWLPVGTGASAIGRLNTNTLSFDVGIQQSLASSDEHKFHTIVTLQIKLKPGMDAWKSAAKKHADLEPKVRAIVEKVSKQIFKANDYRDIFFAAAPVVEALSKSMKQDLSQASPYELLNCTYEAEADDPSVDEAMAVAQREIAREAERARTEQFDLDRIARERVASLASFEHENALAKKREESERAGEAAKTRLRIKLDEEAADAKTRVLTATLSAVSDPAHILAITNPELYAEIRKNEDIRKTELERARITKDSELGKAAGWIEGVKGVLRFQDLNPETIRIVHDNSKGSDDKSE